MDFYLKLPAKYENLHIIRYFVVDICKKSKINGDIIEDMKNIIGETASNIVKYAYKNLNKIKEKDKIIEIKLKIKKNKIILEVIDKGKGFKTEFLNEINKKRIKDKVKIRDQGGYGLYLIKKISDKVEFDINPFKKNVVRIIKNI